MPSQQLASAKKDSRIKFNFFPIAKAKTNQSFKIVPRGVNKFLLLLLNAVFLYKWKLK